MRRRSFIQFVLRCGAAAAAPVLLLTKRPVIARATRAFRLRRYPGRVSRLNGAAIKRPGKWAG